MPSCDTRPERRYASAQRFANDLDRYLNGRPIEARRDSGIYIIRKKLSRNRRVVLVYSVAAAIVAAGLVLTWRSAPEPVASLDPDQIAYYETAKSGYLQLRAELMEALDSLADGVPLDPLSKDSLRITVPLRASESMVPL